VFVTEQFVQIVHMTTQDRRITKTRKAIYTAFLQLLNQKDYESITVQEIIDLADVGRSTFYSHYESKELLLDELCRYLFHHLFERVGNLTIEEYLTHIFSHFKKNQDHVTSLLFSKNDYFLRQLQKELEHHVYPMVAKDLQVSYPSIPASYLKHFVVTNFIETLTWWLKKGKSYKEDQVVRFYLDVIEMKSEKKLL
jgi:transcriptional regulator, tetR family